MSGQIPSSRPFSHSKTAQWSLATRGVVRCKSPVFSKTMMAKRRRWYCLSWSCVSVITGTTITCSGSGPAHVTDPPGVLCNQTWQRHSLARYCDNEADFNAATLGQVRATQVFPQVTEQDRELCALQLYGQNCTSNAICEDTLGESIFFSCLRVFGLLFGLSCILVISHHDIW